MNEIKDEIMSLWLFHPYFNIKKNRYHINKLHNIEISTKVSNNFLMEQICSIKNENLKIRNKRLDSVKFSYAINLINFKKYLQNISKKFFLTIFLKILCILILIYVILIIIYETNSLIPIYCLIFLLAIFFAINLFFFQFSNEKSYG